MAVEAARAGGAVLSSKFLSARTIEFKDERPSNLVTDADKASERVVLDVLRKRAPGHAIVAEESGLTAGTSEFTWYVDPLDGTTNYAHQVPHFCVSIGVARGPTLLAAAIYDPIRSELFSAAAGHGAFSNGVRLKASATQSLDRALLCTGFPYDVQSRPEAPVGLFTRIVLRARGIRRMGSAALDLAYVAAGRFDGFFEFGLKPWDTAAGMLLVQEAGGRACRIDGAPFDLACGDVLAAGPGLFDSLSQETRGFIGGIGWKPDARA